MLKEFMTIKEFISEEKNDFFNVNHTNNCLIKLFDHYSSDKIIVVSVILLLQNDLLHLS